MKKKTKVQKVNKPTFDGRFAELTWEDLESFAGKKAVSRGKGYVSEVTKVCVDDNGAVIASVLGGQEYATKIWFGDSGKLCSYCSCPVGFECKHAVALALKVIDEIKNGKQPTHISEDDERLDELSFDDDLLDEFESEEHLEDCGDASISLKATTASRKKDPVNDYINSLSCEDCRGLLFKIVEEYGFVRTELKRRITLAKSDVETLAAKAKAAIHDATAYPCCFYHRGNRDRSVYPDYSEAQLFLKRLLELKAYDKLIALADYLTKRSLNQMLMSENDEGQIGDEASECMEVIAKAVMYSDMSDVAKILWFRKLHDSDEYCFYEGISGVWETPQKVAKSAWAKVADEFEKELLKMKDVSDEFSYEGRNLLQLIEKALRFSGRSNEIIGVKKKSIAQTGDYLSLVKELIAEGDLKDARVWCVRGLKEGGTCGANELRERLIDISRRLGDKMETCAYIADQFFNTSNLRNYKELIASADDAGVTDDIRMSILKFLETGTLPWKEKKNRWPLPIVGDGTVSKSEEFPNCWLLVEIALDENRLADAVRFYRAQGEHGARKSWWSRGTESDQGWVVADKVSKELPEDAIAIWRGLIKANLGKVGNAYYEQIGKALKCMRPVMECQRKRGEWDSLISELRYTEKSKRNLMKVLDEVEAGRSCVKPIISSGR